MSIECVYKCNICLNKIENPINSFGVNFLSNERKLFSLCGYGGTQEVHICFSCAGQLQNQLAMIDSMEEYWTNR